jgi:hypothetical protein
VSNPALFTDSYDRDVGLSSNIASKIYPEQEEVELVPYVPTFITHYVEELMQFGWLCQDT